MTAQTAFAAPLHVPRAGTHVRGPTRLAPAACASLTEFPAFVPLEAALIADPTARHMLRSMVCTPVQTALREAPIETVHSFAGRRGGRAEGAEGTEVPAVLFLHGFDSNMLEFRRMVPFLDMEEIDAHFVDVLGWGLTEKPWKDLPSFGPDAKREHLFAYWRQVAEGRPLVLVGASIGGAVAIDFALAYPHAVKALVLIAAQAFQDKPASKFLTAFPFLASLGAEVLRSDWLRRMAVKLSYESEELKCTDSLRIGGLHCNTDGWKEAAVNFIQQEGYCVSDRVSCISCPTLVLWGSNDRVLGDSALPHKFLETITDCELQFVQDSGHSPHIEKPEFVTRQVANFVAAVITKGAAASSAIYGRPDDEINN